MHCPNFKNWASYSSKDYEARINYIIKTIFNRCFNFILKVYSGISIDELWKRNIEITSYIVYIYSYSYSYPYINIMNVFFRIAFLNFVSSNKRDKVKVVTWKLSFLLRHTGLSTLHLNPAQTEQTPLNETRRFLKISEFMKF